MIAVAVVGLLLGVVVGGRRLKQRRNYCLEQASHEAQTEQLFRSMESSVASRPLQQRPSIIVEGHTYKAATLAAYYAERKQIYLHAASRPWISVPTTPPWHAFYIVHPNPPKVIFEKTGRPMPKSGDSPSP
jgi:hypothetical protein